MKNKSENMLQLNTTLSEEEEHHHHATREGILKYNWILNWFTYMFISTP